MKELLNIRAGPSHCICTVGYNDFNNLVLPGRWWLLNLILRHIYKKTNFPFFSAFSSAFAFKVCKKCWYEKKKFENCNMDIKNAEFDADFDSIETAAKNLMGESYQRKSDKKWSIWMVGAGNSAKLSLLCAYKFSTYNFFRVIFCTFFNRFELSIEFCVLCCQSNI